MERKLGQQRGLDIIHRMNPHHDELWVFGHIISEGMEAEIKLAKQLGITVEHIDLI